MINSPLDLKSNLEDVDIKKDETLKKNKNLF